MNHQTANARKINPRTIVGVIIFLFYTPIVLCITSGKIDWWMAWVYSIISISLSIGSRVLMARKHPDLVTERASFRDAEGVKEWDKKLVPLIAQVGPFSILAVSGFDKRFGWSPVLPSWIPILALVIAILGFILSTWALTENRYFSSVVRIQIDRGHTVCTSGPYQYIRHPGYTGALIWYMMTPLILGSLLAYIPTVIVVVLIVLRTVLEDRTLRAELPGYKPYMQKTRYRLIPGIW